MPDKMLYFSGEFFDLFGYHCCKVYNKGLLGIPDTYEVKIARISDLWTFWPIIQLLSHLFKIQEKAFLLNAL